MPTELEMKLRIPSVTVADRILSDKMVTDYLASEIKTTPMVSRYYDTETSALLDLRWSLRLRQEGEKSVLSLKTSSADVSGDLFVRKEWQVLSDTVEDRVPLLVEQGAPEKILQLVQNSPLVERCRIEFSRRSTTLKLPDGVLVELAIDKGTIFAGEKSAPIHELELELLFGDPDSLLPLSDLFKHQYGLERDILSKYEKALRIIRSR
jgi:triphosphatase